MLRPSPSRNLTGKTFGRLKVLGYVVINRKLRWHVLCECGNERFWPASQFYSDRGRSVSTGCGCTAPQNGGRHGHAATNGIESPTYISWYSMRKRCCNPNHEKYPRYGAMGIKVCSRWMVFENFLADMGERPKGLTLDRINPYGNYEPENCRWATPTEQARNRWNTSRR
jgi:hypothetical protein